MITDANDPWAVIRELEARVRHLETANPLENASISTGRIRILTPGGDGGGSSSEEAIIGHAYGKKGVLVKEGGQWVTTKEYADGKISASHEYPNARITSLEGFANSYGPTVNTLVSQMAGVDGKISASHDYPNARISGLEGRMSNAESSLGGKASTSSVSLLGGRVTEVEESLGKIRAIYNAHIDAAHPGMPKMTS